MEVPYPYDLGHTETGPLFKISSERLEKRGLLLTVAASFMLLNKLTFSEKKYSLTYENLRKCI